ncbi:MAG: hypothetical protein FWH53_07150, partial [Leptospirales bacterium]|nr:hypothetical protein [Leptospirales bacterium]
QPLLEHKASGDKVAVKFAVIGNVPVQFFYSGGYYIRPDYVKGDLVWVTYATFDIEYGLNNLHDDVSAGAFSRENASIVFGIAPENFNVPDSFNDDGMLIGHKAGVNLQIIENDVIGKGGKFSWDGNFEIKNAVEPAALGNTLATILNNFCTTLSSISPGDPAANAAALATIKAAALTLQNGLDSIKAAKVKIL